MASKASAHQSIALAPKGTARSGDGSRKTYKEWKEMKAKEQVTREQELKSVQERESKGEGAEAARFRKELGELIESDAYGGAAEGVRRQLVGTLVVDTISRLTSQE